ncbi:MAG: c-type cytochrome [Rhodospirillales bacterium]
MAEEKARRRLRRRPVTVSDTSRICAAPGIRNQEEMRALILLGIAAFLSHAGSAFAEDIAAGERSFAKCRACHQIGQTAKNMVGPKLNGIFSRKAGSVEGFNYSEANRKSGVIWNEEVFANYIKDPKAAMPGNKMVFAGIKNDKEIADLIAFLRQFDGEGKKR